MGGCELRILKVVVIIDEPVIGYLLYLCRVFAVEENVVYTRSVELGCRIGAVFHTKVVEKFFREIAGERDVALDVVLLDAIVNAHIEQDCVVRGETTPVVFLYGNLFSRSEQKNYLGVHPAVVRFNIGEFYLGHHLEDLGLHHCTIVASVDKVVLFEVKDTICCCHNVWGSEGWFVSQLQCKVNTILWIDQRNSVKRC